jgi:hypothetical protein
MTTSGRRLEVFRDMMEVPFGDSRKGPVRANKKRRLVNQKFTFRAKVASVRHTPRGTSWPCLLPVSQQTYSAETFEEVNWHTYNVMEEPNKVSEKKHQQLKGEI